MDIGLFAPSSTPGVTLPLLHRLGAAAEERGFASLWLSEHVLFFDDYSSSGPYSDKKLPGGETGMLDPFVALGFLAATTRRIRLGTGVAVLSQRHPVFAAKEAVTVDFLSDGRLDLGVGAGWVREEFAALGLPHRRRGALTDRNLEIIRTLWTDPVSEYHDRGYDLPPSRAYPKPVQKPHPPIYVGGNTDAALRRVVRYGDGWYAFGLTPEQLAERLGELRRLLAEAGRERVAVSVCPFSRPAGADMVERYREAGADQVILVAATATEADLEPMLDRYADTILARAAAL